MQSIVGTNKIVFRIRRRCKHREESAIPVKVAALHNPRSPRIGDVDVKVLPSIAGDWLSALGKRRPTVSWNVRLGAS
ncbi:hypothetical protein ACLOJK_028179 [Asimina triloba]